MKTGDKRLPPEYHYVGRKLGRYRIKFIKDELLKKFKSVLDQDHDSIFPPTKSTAAKGAPTSSTKGKRNLPTTGARTSPSKGKPTLPTKGASSPTKGARTSPSKTVATKGVPSSPTKGKRSPAHTDSATRLPSKREREDTFIQEAYTGEDNVDMPLPDDDYDDDDKDEMSLELDHSSAPPAAKRAREDLSVPVQEHHHDPQQKVASLKQEVANLEKQLEEKKQELAQLLSQLPTSTANQPVEPPEEEDKWVEEIVVDLPPDEDSDEDEDPDGDENQLDVDSKPGKKWTNQPDFLLKKLDFKITDKMIEADLKRLKEIDFHPEGEFLKDHWVALLEIAQKGLEMLKDQQPEKRSKFLVWFEGKCQRHDGGTYYEGKGGAFL